MGGGEPSDPYKSVKYHQAVSDYMEPLQIRFRLFLPPGIRQATTGGNFAWRIDKPQGSPSCPRIIGGHGRQLARCWYLGSKYFNAEIWAVSF